jgi:nucleotide-binding universal stress UspA family protein
MLKKVENVLIGTSLTESSDEVVRAGLRIARAAGAKVFLVHAFSPQMIYGGGAPFVAEVAVHEVLEAEKTALMRRLEEQARRLEILPEELGGVFLEYGAPHRALIEAARLHQADLLMVGASESPRLAKVFGSTADRVVRKSTRPVLVLRGALPVPPRRVLLPVDLSPLSADAFRRGLDLLAQMDPRGSSQVEALFVMTEFDRQLLTPKGQPEASEASALAELDRFVKRHGADAGREVKPRVGLGYVEEEILARAFDWEPDLIVLGTHGAGGFERMLLGSVASGVVRNGKASVLVVPPEAALAESLAAEAKARAASREPVAAGV